MNSVFTLKFLNDVPWGGSVFIHIHWKNMWLPDWKLIPSVLGNFPEFLLLLCCFLHYVVFLFCGTFLEHMLAFLDCCSNFVFSLIFLLIFWLYFLVDVLSPIFLTFVEFFIYAVVFLRFLVCALNFQNNVLFCFMVTI